MPEPERDRVGSLACVREACPRDTYQFDTRMLDVHRRHDIELPADASNSSPSRAPAASTSSSSARSAWAFGVRHSPWIDSTSAIVSWAHAQPCARRSPGRLERALHPAPDPELEPSANDIVTEMFDKETVSGDAHRRGRRAVRRGRVLQRWRAVRRGLDLRQRHRFGMGEAARRGALLPAVDRHPWRHAAQLQRITAGSTRERQHGAATLRARGHARSHRRHASGLEPLKPRSQKIFRRAAARDHELLPMQTSRADLVPDRSTAARSHRRSRTAVPDQGILISAVAELQVGSQPSPLGCTTL
jgi:hypothetical protein